MSEARPSQSPPVAGISAASASGAGDAPSLLPPVAGSGGGASGGVTAWNGNKKVSGLWGISQNRNSWAHIIGIGWKKLANNSDTAVVALTILAAHAKQAKTNCSYRDEADGMIHEMYVW